MKKVLCAFLLILAVASASQNLTIGKSRLGVEESAQRLQKLLNDKGLKIFGVFEHSKLAKEAGLEMQNTIVVAFGAPSVGTKLMQCQPEIALDLPLKILFYEQGNQAFVAYEDIKHIAKRYEAKCDDVVNAISKTQEHFFKVLTQK